MGVGSRIGLVSVWSGLAVGLGLVWGRFRLVWDWFVSGLELVRGRFGVRLG